MKRILILLLFVVIIVLLLIPFKDEVAIKINTSYYICYQQLSNPANWKKWQPDIIKGYNTDSALFKSINNPHGFNIVFQGGSFLVKQSNSNNILINRTMNNDDFSYSYTIIPDTSGSNTTIIVSYKTNAIKHFIPILNKKDLDKTAIYDFKNYIEDPKLYYGFDIRSGSLNERNIIVKRKTVLLKNICTEALGMENQLRNYIQLKHLLQTGSVIEQYISNTGDSVKMMVAIPINKEVVADNDILYMHVPATKVLTADFKGKYNEKQKIYSALGKYIQDKYLHVKSSPDEVFMGNLPASANDVVTFRLTYPIL